jgi:hypothetical protein
VNETNSNSPLSTFDQEKPLKAWISILRQSTRWNFKDLQLLATEKVKVHYKQADPVEILRLGQEYHIHELVVHGYTELSLRQKPLSLAEAEELGLHNILLICQLRERATLVAYNCASSRSSVNPGKTPAPYQKDYPNTPRAHIEQKLGKVDFGQMDVCQWFDALFKSESQ